jgi:transposase
VIFNIIIRGKSEMKRQVSKKARRKQYSREFKQQALLRAERDGVAQAAQDLGLQEGQLYTWRGKAKREGQTSEEQRLLQSEHARLKREVSRLEEENSFLKKAAAYFAKQPK